MKWRKSKHIGINQRDGQKQKKKKNETGEPLLWLILEGGQRWLPWQHFYAQINFAIAGCFFFGGQLQGESGVDSLDVTPPALHKIYPQFACSG